MTASADISSDLLPIGTAFSRFPRLVRDLSTKAGKKIQLVLSGEETELDKTVIESIGDPLTHLVRNSADHGLETPDQRKASGKSEKGTIRLSAYHEGGHIIIEISDDGRGFDTEVAHAGHGLRSLRGRAGGLGAESLLHVQKYPEQGSYVISSNRGCDSRPS